MMVIPSFRMAGLICRHMPSGGFQRTPDSEENIGQILLRYMQKGCGRYHRIIALNCIQFVMPHDPYRAFQALLRLSRHFRDAVRSIDDKTPLCHISSIDTAATAQFKNGPRRWQQIKKGRNMAGYITGMVVDIMIGVLLIESQRLRIISVHIVATGTSPE